ncbi:MAG TPA: hypothetical protein VMB71_04635 [Acetobacteraceae bacterium]|nr:hypothetical protein [Acetobacteraceae bacterium]
MRAHILELGLLAVSLLLATSSQPCSATSPALALGVPLYPFITQQPEADGGGDRLGERMAEAMQHPGSAGAVVTLCWVNEEPKPDDFRFLDGPDRTLVSLAKLIKPGQHVILGIKAGNCAPPWLSTNFGVPLVEAYHGGEGGDTPRGCPKMYVAVSYNPKFIDRYDNVAHALWDATGKLKTGDGSTLQSRMLALKNGGMSSARTEEMGINALGCKHGGVVYQTPEEVAQKWANLPGENAFRPAKIVPAYMKMLDGLFAFLPPNVSVSQDIHAEDRAAFPWVSDNGGLAPEGGGRQPLVEGILLAAAHRYGNRIIFGWNALALREPGKEPPRAAQVVMSAGRAGAGMDWQLNGKGGQQHTSCYGRGDPTQATPQCFAQIIAYGMSLVPPESNHGKLHWIEFHPRDAVENPLF